MAMKQFTKKLSFAELLVYVNKIGEEYCIQISGGDKPHIGCVVMAIPRPSLKNPDIISATSSVLNVTGHKDEYICRYIAEEIAKQKNVITVCTGGFHIDGITEEQIQELLNCIKELVKFKECLDMDIDKK